MHAAQMLQFRYYLTILFSTYCIGYQILLLTCALHKPDMNIFIYWLCERLVSQVFKENNYACPPSSKVFSFLITCFPEFGLAELLHS